MGVRDLFELKGKVALVTGGSRGLGLQIAKGLADMGAKIAISARKPAELEEAALMDGANPVQTFWRVVFPAMRPINIIVLVVTVIESLRAFDLVYITNQGTNGLQLLSSLITSNIVGEVSRIGFGSALGVVLLVISLVPISIFLYQTFGRSET